MKQTFQRYKQNLSVRNGNEVWSYSTKVGIIKEDCIEELGYWSMTTRKHLNYVAKEYCKPLNKFC